MHFQRCAASLRAFDSCTVWGELPGSCRRHNRLRKAHNFFKRDCLGLYLQAHVAAPLDWNALTEVLVMLGDGLLSKWAVVLGYMAQGLLLHKPARTSCADDFRLGS